MQKISKLEMLPYRVLNKRYWNDFTTLFGERGACGGCWCMNWRVMKAEFEQGKSGGNKKKMQELVDSGNRPGIIGYNQKQPIAWCSVAPRNQFPRLEKSRVLSPVDDLPVWSISCLFLAKQWQRQGLSSRLLLSAVDYARKRGASIVEGYPFEPTTNDLPAPFVWTGLAVSYLKAGFVEIARRSATRPIMRLHL
ncbi:MAG: GNAT family N-acetyltransferase [bacterium]|nr:GNAT family N-acetyltransferase [bacterium]